MKKYFLFSMALLWLFFSPNAYCQVDKITYPANGSIFQQNDAGQYLLSFGGTTRKESNLPSLKYTLYQMNASGQFQPVTNHEAVTINPSNTKTNITNRLIFDYAGINLNKGFYRIKIFSRRQYLFFSTKDYTKDIIEFGVGDVYFISGQSNAAGFNYPSGKFQNQFILDNFPKPGKSDFENKTDATIPFLNNNSNVSNLSRIYNLNGKYEWHKGWVEDELDPNNRKKENVSVDGLPYKSSFVAFRNGTNEDTDPGWIYPNGMASWCWQPLGYKIATNSDPIISKTPNIFFNVAYPGAKIESFANNQSDGLKMMQTMRLFGNIMGAKAVLWHQGEENSASDLYGDNTIPNYQSNLLNVINMSRSVLGDNSTNPRLSWYVSKVSQFTSSTVSSPPSGFTSTTITGNARQAANKRYINSNIRAKQTNILNSNLRIYTGIDSDNITGGSRDADLQLHFSDNSTLNSVADQWYTSIKQNYQIGGVTPTAMVPIDFVTKYSNSSYRLKVIKADGAEYFWCKNSKGIVSGEYDGITNGVREFTFNNVNEGDILTCYIKDNSGRFFACQPFLASDASAKFIETPTSTISFGNSGGTYNLKIVSQNLDWDVYSKPSWVNLDFNEDELNLIVSTTSYSGSIALSDNIVLKEVGGNVTKTITVTQTGSTSTIPLTSLTPNSGSGFYNLNLPIGGGAAFSVSGPKNPVTNNPYSNGFGVHANNSLYFSLGGQYSTFTGAVGRDDNGDNIYGSGNVQFFIKADGTQIWSSYIHGNTTGPEFFNVNVTGKNTLELFTYITNDADYFDHGDWMDLFISTGPGNSCTNLAATNLAANPSIVSTSGGNSTLSASCPAGTSPLWSGGSLGSTSGSPITTFVSATTNYSVVCIGNSCNPSSPIGVSVTVPPPGGCSNITNNQTIGTWAAGNGTTYPLVARSFNGQMWLTQRTSTNPETFLVRGSYMLTRPDVTTSFSSQIACFAWVADCSNCFGGLATPNSIEFPTPSGFTLGFECSEAPCNATNGTPYYYATTIVTPPNCTGSTYLTNTWTYGSAGYNPPPKIGTNIGGGNMSMGNVNYTTSYPNTGIGTHSTSEIIYDLGLNHPYTHFLATVGKDNAALCGNQYGQEKLLFKVLNHDNGSVLATSPYLGNPNSGMPQTSNMSVSISGVRYLKLLMEDGGDGSSCDWGNWARARLACSANGRVAAKDSTENIEFMQIVPNPNAGEFELLLYLEEDSPVDIALLNSIGIIFETMHFQGQKGMNIIPYKTKKVGEGNYLLRVITNNKVQSQTVVIK
ncbi:T9SS C-terminal target domain-containing protein [Lacihabitans sp. LS3-19]|uniref:NPCBM/NEW2 domain-containing protein n=1 Tax=Lacihabitans sp. LS3-19 TaxID=2487335 RepID=UPI0020CD9781|nr:NPCBM/NEW2 domain-containing protein [Lacihabitans sp. LS3-19]MCP9770398.1 T9SS C-terminal target domain-containing protein [Lacihabitans sp. LS3-19]